MGKFLLLLALLSATTNAFAQAGKNFIKPVDKNGFEVDSIISVRGDEIVYLRAGTEFDIKRAKSHTSATPRSEG